LFGPDGYKLSDDDEAQIEHLLIENPPKLADADAYRPRAADRRCARALYPCREASLARSSPPRWAAHRDRLREWRRL
jgi:hypothetical protein